MAKLLEPEDCQKLNEKYDCRGVYAFFFSLGSVFMDAIRFTEKSVALNGLRSPGGEHGVSM